MTSRSFTFALWCGAAFWLCAAMCLGSGTATGITGLYYTGDEAGSTSLATQGSTDGNWSVTYASTNGGSSSNSTYMGSAYVVTNSTIAGSGYVQDTGTAQWITAPGASTSSSGSNTNQGGDYLPGNGTSGSNEGIYLYTLAFQVTGTGSGTVSNEVAISLTIAADDSYSVFVNPTTNLLGILPYSSEGTAIPNSTASASGSSAWGNTTSISLANYTDTANGYADNANFVIGTNYLVIEVVNSNSQSGSSGSTALNASGLLVYGSGSLYSLNGHPIPEMHTWIPMCLAALTGVILLWKRPKCALV